MSDFADTIVSAVFSLFHAFGFWLRVGFFFFCLLLSEILIKTSFPNATARSSQESLPRTPQMSHSNSFTRSVKAGLYNILQLTAAIQDSFIETMTICNLVFYRLVSMLFSELTGSIAEQFWASQFYFSILTFYYEFCLCVSAQLLSLAAQLLHKQIFTASFHSSLVVKKVKKFSRFYLLN